ncbi:hypothetical protein [Hyalangium versicolor]|uniref:hypothetical protein n=1 Tax=Hyalangium versicolor TaxID=2861190 RepID=UPI001CCF77C8|nr:hypothetical protein [Hyalangium versicolor]
MNHMPYEDTGMSASPDQEPQREAPSHEDPGRTPHSAEGTENEREVPLEEPGKTPGSAEGEDPDNLPEAPRY